MEQCFGFGLAFWYIFGDHDALDFAILGGFAIGDDFAILEELCYMLETLIMMP